MVSEKKLPAKWQKEQKTVKAIQVAFDIGEEFQYRLRKEALDLGVNPSDRVRQILGLPTNKRVQRPRLSISLSELDFELLAEEFGLEKDDKVAIKQRAATQLIAYIEDSRED
ncbi:MAG: hypothetical protein COB04_00140 [Gammaproteobacteria bacterium]|nr:MAG: hypothetical protein COB04_00140 [Gammaproteobacteria bacterium]